MSHFYGTLQGGRGMATRCGTKNSGISVVAAGWGGAIQTDMWVDHEGNDCYQIGHTEWCGRGINKVIAEGVVGKAVDIERLRASFEQWVRENCRTTESTFARPGGGPYISYVARDLHDGLPAAEMASVQTLWVAYRAGHGC